MYFDTSKNHTELNTQQNKVRVLLNTILLIIISGENGNAKAYSASKEVHNQIHVNAALSIFGSIKIENEGSLSMTDYSGLVIKTIM